MTTTDQIQPASMPTSRKVLCAVYALIAVAALIATWSQTVAYLHSGPADFFVNFWHDAKVTASARNITADILMFGLSAAVLMVIEARKHGVRFVWLYILGGFIIAVSVTFPLFLIAREMRIGASDSPRLHAIDAVLLAVLAAGLAGLTIWVDIG
jgi:4-amino-4-deoxy-L-arabinose transferase-like glycosyltransferase